MANVTLTAQPQSLEEFLEVMRGLAPGFRERALDGERLRSLPPESAAQLIDAGVARMLVPKRWGGLELGLGAWLDVTLEAARADASHGWCTSLLIQQPVMFASFPEAAQAAVWAEGPNVAIAGSLMPVLRVERVEGGYRISGKSPFASGVSTASWVWLGGMVQSEAGGPPTWTLFLVPAGEYEVLDTWHMAAMSGTGSNTIVTDDVFVPEERTVTWAQMVSGEAPGAQLHDNPLYRTPFASYNTIGFAGTVLGAARGAYEHFRDSTKTKKTPGGGNVAETTSIQVQMARASADLDAAELLLRRMIATAEAPEGVTLELRARSMRDSSRAAELVLGAIDTLLALSGTAGFASTNPIQRAWRDIHFATRHASLSPENSFAHWGRTQLGVERPASMPVY
jgi:3-hydroxy-9,10-secoandrosta-1,3,5(10)-triene-9,17-dione monooxygenase